MRQPCFKNMYQRSEPTRICQSCIMSAFVCELPSPASRSWVWTGEFSQRGQDSALISVYSLQPGDVMAYMWTRTHVCPCTLSYRTLQTRQQPDWLLGGATVECYWLRCCIHLLPVNANNQSCRWQTRGASGRPCEAEGAQGGREGGRRARNQQACAFFPHIFSSPHPPRTVII